MKSSLRGREPNKNAKERDKPRQALPHALEAACALRSLARRPPIGPSARSQDDLRSEDEINRVHLTTRNNQHTNIQPNNDMNKHNNVHLFSLDAACELVQGSSVLDRSRGVNFGEALQCLLRTCSCKRVVSSSGLSDSQLVHVGSNDS